MKKQGVSYPEDAKLAVEVKLYLRGRALDAAEAGVGEFLEGMLPDADDFPAPAPEPAGDAAVAGYVGLAFAVPEGAGGALAAAVPIDSAVRCQNARDRYI